MNVGFFAGGLGADAVVEAVFALVVFGLVIFGVKVVLWEIMAGVWGEDRGRSCCWILLLAVIAA